MQNRIRTILIIILVNLIIISFSVFTGTLAVQNRIDKSQEADMTLVSDIADHFLSSEIANLKLQAAMISERVSASDSAEWQGELAAMCIQYTDFIGMSVISPDDGILASAGEAPALSGVISAPFAEKALHGKTAFSSTTPVDGFGVVLYIASPLTLSSHAPPPLLENILVLTLPGLHFNQCLSTFNIWDTGHIFIGDTEGYAISTSHEPWVTERFNFIEAAETDKSFKRFAEVLKRMKNGESGTANYSIDGIPRVSSFRPITGSEEGWSLCAVAPLPESPFRDANVALIVVGFVSVALSIVAAIIASNYIKKPFEEIAALKEEAEASSKAKSDFLANMSHEIRTPMNAILGITEILLRDENINNNVSNGLNSINNSGDLLLNIINDILDLSKIEAGKLELFHTKYELASLINDSVVLNMMRRGSKQIEFKLNVDKNLPSTLIGDELRIKQILNNLLSNAFTYTEEGKVVLSFSIGETGDDAGSDIILVISVSDTGIGMSQDQVRELYDAYSRFNIDKMRVREGSGLGMSIAKNLLVLMDGDIFVESEPGVGTVITVRIPQGASDNEVLGKEVVDALCNFQSNGVRQLNKSNLLYEPMPYGKVLVVDDVESNVFVTKGLMAPYKLNIDTAYDGLQAIEKISDGNVYDIIFMDHMMPKMDGMEATKIIRAQGYESPIVALTANAVAGQMEIFLANGFDDFISKPIDARLLNAVLKKYVRDKQPPEVIEALNRRMQDMKEEILVENIISHEIPPQLAELFILDAHKAIRSLEEVIDKGGNFNDEDFNNYRGAAHAIKGALSSIGESELSAAAKNLEQAGHEKKEGIILDETQAFLSRLKSVVADLSSSADNNEEETLVVDNVYLCDKLSTIIQACDVYDRKTAKDTIIELRQGVWPPRIKEVLGLMTEQLLGGDYSDLADTAERLTETLTQ